ncbi:flagellar hook-basal body complex protein FliE [Blastomonas sp.]|jgi:flagellar hook-basal body complex protein FliE|uniref:flagellar hook-basal body complex protein FliE n=1 Tax=Alphaproteobacteria TaxID=28211 RepID=UPI0026129EBF|nr:flagellar hook-basal body complex protein FliE [Blastomonas sp.]MDM7957973.1 flagellar hook-basal body complex protein FliE [Blastomonas sp.]
MNVNRVAEVMALRNTILQRNAVLREAVSTQGANTTGQPEGAAATPSFAATLQTALNKVNALQEQEDVVTEAYERGETTDIATVALMQQRASISFEATLQVRNKLLSAYKDVMNMAV